jgi:hypothetical protein
MYVTLQSSTCFEHQHAYLLEDKLYYHSIVIVTLCKRLYSISFTNFNAQFLYSLTICMLHYNPRHVSSINMPIFWRTNCIITASGIVTLCKRLYSMPDESRLQMMHGQKNIKKYINLVLFLHLPP